MFEDDEEQQGFFHTGLEVASTAPTSIDVRSLELHISSRIVSRMSPSKP